MENGSLESISGDREEPLQVLSVACVRPQDQLGPPLSGLWALWLASALAEYTALQGVAPLQC